MILIDIAEKPYVFLVFDKLGIPYKKELLIFPSKCDKFPLVINNDKEEMICINKEMGEILQDIDPKKFQKDTFRCADCDSYGVRIGDFTNDTHSFIIERKRVDDFYASMVDGRLYEQARNMYKWFDGLKIIIIEGMNGMDYLEDGFDPFKKEDIELSPRSPIQQLLEMKPEKKDWIWGMISDLASCNVALVQTWNLEETVMFVKEIDKGAGHDPKVRAIPKKVSGLSLEEQMLTTIPGIGKSRAQNIIAEYGSLGKLITEIRKMPKKEAEKHSITKKLKEVFS